MGDYLAAVRSGIDPLLSPGEQALYASPLGKDVGTTEDVDVKDELKNLLDPTLLIGMSHPGELLQRASFGRALVGGPDSTAGRVHAVVDRSLSVALVVTDRRLLLVTLTHVPEGSGWRKWFVNPGSWTGELRHEVPRSLVAAAVEAPTGLSRRRRVLVGFSDGSSVALQVGSREILVALLSAPTPPEEHP